MPHQLIIDYDNDLLANVGLSPDEFAEEARLLLAAKLYEQGKLSSGQAAKLCVKGRVEFLYSLVRAGIRMSNLRPDDAELEIDFALYGQSHLQQGVGREGG
jgi:predicted HTH domain antitoxin